MAPWAFDPSPFRAQSYGLEAANRYCRNMARSHYENFPVAVSLFTKEQRQALSAIYAFARTADDFSDELEFRKVRERLLDDWEDQLRRCFRSEATHPVLIALREVIERFELPETLFLNLLDAFRQDCRKTRYETFEELLDYCRRSANPVGRLVLRVLGSDTRECLKWSDRICTALQLTNFWQDISVDAAKGRIYIPREDMRRFRVSEKAILSAVASLGLGALIRFEVDRTKELFRAGRPLLVHTGFIAALYLFPVWLGGRAVLRLVGKTGADIVTSRPTITAGSLARAITGAGCERLPLVQG